MSIFENITITKKANIYFDGKVTSRSLEFPDGTTKTLGIMMPGEYHFNTDLAERMDITAGDVRYKLAGSDQWQTAKSGESFDVPASSSFDITANELTDYCCSFIK